MSSRSSGYSNTAYCNMYDDYECGEPESFSLYQCHDETFVDEMYEQEQEHDERSREHPQGAMSRNSTPCSTPRKVPGPLRPRRQRSFSAPRNHTANILAPMIAQLQEPPAIRRSRSAVFCKEERDDRRLSAAESRYELLGQRGHPTRRTIAVGQSQNQNRGYRVAPVRQQPVSPRPQDLCQPRPYQKSLANLAVIPPNTRPLLPPSPPDMSLEKGSWASLPLTRRPSNNTLYLSGLFLLFTSTLNCLLCFYLLAKLGLQKGRHYYIDFAVISGFAMLVLGYLGVRMGRYDWVLNRNYLAGYMVLSMLDVLLCAVLGLLASDWRPPDLPEILEIASGAVCGLSALMLLLALCLGASTCCKSPPPDNRVSHNVPSFIV